MMLFLFVLISIVSGLIAGIVITIMFQMINKYDAKFKKNLNYVAKYSVAVQRMNMLNKKYEALLIEPEKWETIYFDFHRARSKEMFDRWYKNWDAIADVCCMRSAGQYEVAYNKMLEFNRLLDEYDTKFNNIEFTRKESYHLKKLSYQDFIEAEEHLLEVGRLEKERLDFILDFKLAYKADKIGVDERRYVFHRIIPAEDVMARITRLENFAPTEYAKLEDKVVNHIEFDLQVRLGTV